jgi:hypothetical protein
LCCGVNLSADFANTICLRIAATFEIFYDVLEAPQAMLELAQENQKTWLKGKKSFSSV